jgi:hypothetical protein
MTLARGKLWLEIHAEGMPHSPVEDTVMWGNFM